jgi:hypothetical protein
MKNCLEWEYNVNWAGQHLPETCMHWRIDSNKYFSGAIYQIIFHSKKNQAAKMLFMSPPPSNLSNVSRFEKSFLRLQMGN